MDAMMVIRIYAIIYDSVVTAGEIQKNPVIVIVKCIITYKSVVAGILVQPDSMLPAIRYIITYKQVVAGIEQTNALPAIIQASIIGDIVARCIP